jgi:hypothetical protein
MEQKQLLLPAPSEEVLAQAAMEINEFLETDIPRVLGTYEEPAVATKTLCHPTLRKRFVDEPVDLSEVVWSKEAIAMFVPMAPVKRKRFEDEPVDLSGVVCSKEAIAMHVQMAPVKRKRF